MKKLLFLIFILFNAGLGWAQLGDILKKTVEVTTLSEQEAITTSIKDALPVVFWLNDLDKTSTPIISDDYTFNIAPGYYRFSLQTYCLHAGTYSPTEGSGYLMAPLLGKKNTLVRSILQRSADHPEIQQHDVQLLIWDVEAGCKFSDLPVDFQSRVKPLLTNEEIALMQVDVKEIGSSLLPDNLKEIANFYSNLRKKLVNPASSYEDIENYAVRQGLPALGPGSKMVNPGNWAAVGNGFYMRSFPYSYPHSDIEVYRVSFVNVTYDNKGRINSCYDNENKIEVSYEDSPGSDMITFNGKQYPIWRFKSVHLTGTDISQDLTFENQGWIIPSKVGNKKDNKGQGVVQFSREGDPSLSEYNDRNSEHDGFMNKMENYVKEKLGDKFNEKTFGDNKDTKSLDDRKHFDEGMKAALSDDLKAKGQWIAKNTELTTDAWKDAANALAGNEDDANRNKDSKKRFDPTNRVSAPGNTSMQRLGTSIRQYNTQ